jgi:hypothetical protein
MAQKNTRALNALLAPERSFQPAKLALDQDTVPVLCSRMAAARAGFEKQKNDGSQWEKPNFTCAAKSPFGMNEIQSRNKICAAPSARENPWGQARTNQEPAPD